MTDLRALAEAILCQATGARRVARLCPVCGSSAHGQPRLLGSDLHVSVSYADGLVAVAWGVGPLGVDIEHTRQPGAGVQAWTRLEALAKAAGTGLRDWPDMTLPDLPTRRLELPSGYVGTLAGAGEVRLAGPAAPSSAAMRRRGRPGPARRPRPPATRSRRW